MKYIIVHGSTTHELQQIVQEAIDEGGYIPCGGMAVQVQSSGQPIFYQSLAKKL